MAEPPALQVLCQAAIGPLALDVTFATAVPWTVLFGASGSGKSSLLRVIAGLWTPAGSKVLLGGDDLSSVPTHRRCIGLVAQQPALFPHLDVLRNVSFGCKDIAVAESMLDFFQLASLRRASVHRLSGGERQRVALARALAAAPRLLLLDEVFTGMHLQQRDDLLRRVRQHCKNHSISVLSVTHDAVEAGLVADEVLQLDAGRIIARGFPADVLARERRQLRDALRDS